VPGQLVTFTATFYNFANDADAATGTMQFVDGNTPLGTVALSGGKASLSVSLTIAGPHQISGNYSGDASFLAASGGGMTQIVKTVPTLALSASTNSSTLGQPITLTASVTPVAATGTVQFLDGSALLGSVPLSGGSAALALSTLSVGVHSITAVYSGDTNDATNTSAPFALTVSKAPATVALTSSANPATAGQPLTLTAAVSPAAATGTVQFLDGATVLGAVPMSGGSAALALFTPSVGAHSITAMYSGDSKYATSTSPLLTQSVSKAPTSASLTSSANPAAFGQSLTLRAAVAPSAATGTVHSWTVPRFWAPRR
jgi:hypothetical protein